MRDTGVEVNERDLEAEGRTVTAAILGESADWFSVSTINDLATITVHGEINIGVNFQKLEDQLQGAKEIRLRIRDCPGGCVSVAMAFFKVFHGSISETIIAGRCFSAALPMALAGSVVKMQRDARILLHAPTSFCYGNAETLAVQSRLVELATKQLCKILMERTELPEQAVNGWLNGADVYLSAEVARAYGVVDEIIEPRPKIAVPAPVVPIGSTCKSIEPRGPTEDEVLFYDFLAAFGRMKVRNRATFMREVCAWSTYNTDEEP